MRLSGHDRMFSGTGAQMVKTALPEHLDLVKKILQSGAVAGSWDSALRAPGPTLDSLLGNIRRSLASGFVRQLDPRVGKEIDIHIAGYVYCPAPDAPPIGFGLFKDFSPSGLELWLLGIDEPWRGKGHGKALLAELLAAPLGGRAELARCAFASESAQRVSRILKARGFATRYTTPSDEWLLHARTPAHVVRAIMLMGVPPVKSDSRRA
jgi:GNAT superfamily N-acetyltransferase